jgi:hypothetical protein
VSLATRKSGRGTLQEYEFTNLLFFLLIIIALGIVVALVFNHYRTLGEEPSEEEGVGVVSDALDSTSDLGMFYLGTKISETNYRYRSRIEIPVTDDGFLKELFSLPGVEEITINKKTIMVKKYASARWDPISAGMRRIVNNHLHIHY